MVQLSAATPPKAFTLWDITASHPWQTDWGQVTLQEPSDENSNKGVEKSSSLFKVMGRRREGPSQVPRAASAFCISAAPSLQQGLLVLCTHNAADPASPLLPNKHCCLLYNSDLYPPHPSALQPLLPDLSCTSQGFLKQTTQHDATSCKQSHDVPLTWWH